MCGDEEPLHEAVEDFGEACAVSARDRVRVGVRERNDNELRGAARFVNPCRSATPARLRQCKGATRACSAQA